MRRSTCLSLVALAGLSGLSLVVSGVAPAATTAAPQAHRTIVNAPRHGSLVSSQRASGTRNAAWTATNWSGYGENLDVTGATGTWTIPAVSATSSPTYSSMWVGTDGFSNGKLIQAGSEQDYYSGATHYDCWWEILPAAETQLSTTTYPCAPGNTMVVDIYETAGSVTSGGKIKNVWVITMANLTKGWLYSTTQGYLGGVPTGTDKGAAKSAEWIIEAPQVNGSTATLSHYTINPPAGSGAFRSVGITTAVTPVGAGAPKFVPAGLSYTADSGTMVQANVIVSSPSQLNTAATAFNMAYGPTTPAAPTN